MTDKKEAIIILAHGSRNREAQEEFVNFTARLTRKQPGLRIEYACLQLVEPNLHEVIEHLYNEGIRYIAVIPFLLFRGMHIVRDIPEIIEKEKVTRPGLEIVLGNVLLPDERLQDIVIERIKEII